jgi:hypothetical protein
LHAFFKQQFENNEQRFSSPEICFYDVNPFQFFVYAIQLILLKKAKTKKKFFELFFCKKYQQIDSNAQSVLFNKKPISEKLKSKTLRALPTSVLKSVFSLILEENQCYPFYKFDGQDLFDGKKLHSQKTFFTTLYFEQCEPFEEQYLFFRDCLLKSHVKFIWSNVTSLVFSDFSQIYIDGIDDKNCTYLDGRSRKELFELFQKQKKHVLIYSTKSQKTLITPTQIEVSSSAQIQKPSANQQNSKFTSFSQKQDSADFNEKKQILLANQHVVNSIFFGTQVKTAIWGKNISNVSSKMQKKIKKMPKIETHAHFSAMLKVKYLYFFLCF